MNNLMTSEEALMVADYIVLTLVTIVIDVEISKVNTAGFKFPEIIKALYKREQGVVLSEITQFRKELTDRGIKVYERSEYNNSVEYKFICRGHDYSMEYLSETLRVQSMMKMCELLKLDSTNCEGVPWGKS
jgi:hypothetical protein